ncbi:MAG: pentapeptide repeat-containing protein [Proteobacteria bacterium]|nr:pentapeptide repeat-containing protein [Pseudomonadota bacterium]
MVQKEITKAIKASDEGLLEALLASHADLSLEAASFKGDHIGAIRIHGVDAGNTEWEACIFDGTVFDGLNLQGAFFNGCTFHNCTFRSTILAETAFDGCVLHRTTFGDTEDAEGLELTNTQFRDCSLVNLHLLDASLESLTITQGRLAGIDGVATLKSVVLRNVTIEGFDTGEMTLTGCIASGCNVTPEGFTASEGKRRRV